MKYASETVTVGQIYEASPFAKFVVTNIIGEGEKRNITCLWDDGSAGPISATKWDLRQSSNWYKLIQDASGGFIEKIFENENPPKALRYNQGKTPYELIPYDALEEITKVFEYGAKKYSAHNWAQGDGIKWSIMFGCVMRHLLAWFRGEDDDKESGLSHLAHAACNIMMLLRYGKESRYKVGDDR